MKVKVTDCKWTQKKTKYELMKWMSDAIDCLNVHKLMKSILKRKNFNEALPDLFLALFCWL